MRSSVKLTVAEVTYREARDLAERYGISRNTVASWSRAGAVERLERGRRVFYREEDVEILVMLTAKETRALGIRRQSPEDYASTRRWMERIQTRTRAEATHAGEEWDAISEALALDADGPLFDVALRLGRTYAAITDRRSPPARKVGQTT